MNDRSSGEAIGQWGGKAAGNLVRRDGAMTTFTLFDRLAADLAASGHGAAGRRAMARLAAIGVDLRGAPSPLDLARRCASAHDPGWDGATLAACCDRAPADPLCTAVVLVALEPSLRTLAARLVRRGLASDEAAAVVVAAAVDALADRAGWVGSRGATLQEAPGVVVAETWRRARRVSRRAERDARGEQPVACPPEPAAAGGLDDAVDDPLLARALRTGVLTVRQAAVVHETRVLGRPLCELAAAWGCAPGALVSVRRRAERRLRAMVVAERAAGRRDGGR